MGLREDLASEDDATRLAACRRAASDGRFELVPQLLDLALCDSAEVKTSGGLAESWETVSKAAASALAAILERQGETEAAARAVGTDLRHDDEAVGQLLYYLGRRAEAVRRELETHPEPRVRLRALKAVLATERTAELVRRMLADPSPLVRIEAASSLAAWPEFGRVLPSEEAPEVRLAIAREMRAGSVHADAILETLERERDPAVRLALLQCLPSRWSAGPRVTEALRRALEDPNAATRAFAATTLRQVDDRLVGQTIARRVPIETNPRALYELLSYRHLARYGPELLPFIVSLFIATNDGLLRSAALHTLVDYGWKAQPSVLPLVVHANAELRAAARFFVSKHPSVATLAQLRALKANSDELRRDLKPLIDDVAAAVKAGGIEVPTPSSAGDADTTRLELSGPARRAVAARPGATIAVAEGETPTRLTLRLACGSCGAHARVDLPVRYQSMDDDRFAARETTWEAGGWMNCPACAAAWCVEAGLDLVEPRSGGQRTLSWRAAGRQEGARMVAGVGA